MFGVEGTSRGTSSLIEKGEAYVGNDCGSGCWEGAQQLEYKVNFKKIKKHQILNIQYQILINLTFKYITFLLYSLVCVHAFVYLNTEDHVLSYNYGNQRKIAEKII